MKFPTRSSHTKGFIAIASVAWLGVVYAFALFVLGVSSLAAWGITTATATLLGSAIAYLAWEFRHAKPLPGHKIEGHVQDVNLLLLSRSIHTPRHHQRRRTRSRLCGQHPVTDRIVSFHRPPHSDRRMKIHGDQSLLEIGPFLDVSNRRTSITPSAN